MKMHTWGKSVILQYQQLRCTKKQIAEDESIVRAQACANKELIAANHHANVNHITQLESQALQAKRQAHTHALRPDLHSNS